ncbi:MAG TPA: S9 family peptidase [Pyrinomonadaceae bacterium]|nr:S9 family peptidase [Pyrinomonadaceae bacterium]
MQQIKLFLTVTAVLFCFIDLPGNFKTHAVSTTHTITPEDVLGIRELSDLRLSPDGKQVVFVITEPADPNTQRRASNLWIMPTNGRESPRALIPGLINAGSPRWSPDGKTLAFLSDRARPGSDEAEASNQIYQLGAGEANAVRLTSVPGGVEQFEWSNDSKMIAFVARDQPLKKATRDDAIEVDRHLEASRLWVTTVADQKAVQVTKQDFEIVELAWSPTGDELALVVAPTPKAEDSLNLSLVVVNRATGEVARTLNKYVNLAGGLKWSPDGRLITFFEGPASKEFASWVSVVPAGGGEARAVLKDYAGSVLRLEWMPDSRHLIALAMEGTHQSLLAVDVATGDRVKLGDVTHSQWNVGFSTNGNTTAYFAETSESPSDIWILRTGESPRKLTNFNPQTAAWRVGKLREIEWKNSKDGLVRRGVLITPPDYQPGQRYPTIVNTHPGDTAWWMGWHSSKWWDWGQLLASNGYVVFLPNTRGVTGEGWRMHQAIADWGGMAFQDLMDGVDYLVQQGIADPNRLGIGGWSNGGFMTEYAITHTTRFKAAVAQAGHSDFFSLYGTSYLSASLRISFHDSPYLNRKGYDERSPITSIRNCRTPTLLLHGELDSGVPVGQAYEFYNGLKDIGVETQMVVYPRERHNIQEGAHQLDIQRRMLAWFDKHLK